MQNCGYCGKANEDGMTHCAECGTTLAPETHDTAEAVRSFAEFARWTPTSPFGLAVASGLGAFLISTAIYYAVGRLTLDVYRVFQSETTDSLFYTEVVMFFPFMSPLLGIAAVSFIWFAVYWRHQERRHALLSALVTSLVAVLFIFGPRFVPDFSSLVWVLPVTLIGIGTGMSVGYYFGAVLQIVIGAWLLGWFTRRKSLPGRPGVSGGGQAGR